MRVEGKFVKTSPMEEDVINIDDSSDGFMDAATVNKSCCYESSVMKKLKLKLM